MAGGTQTAAEYIERCVDARSAVAANANQAVLIECWLSDLGRITRGESVAV